MKALSDESKRVIAEASAADLPSPALQARLWEGLSQRLSEPLPETAAAASAALDAAAPASVTTASLAGVGAKLVIGALSLGALGALGFVAYRTVGAPEPAAAPPSAPHASTVPAAVEPVAPAPAGALPTPEQPASRLSEETQLMAAMQRALSGAAPSRALALIDQHRRRFPRGALAQEREAARVLALCALGRHAEAHTARQRFLRAWPDSPLTRRVRAECSRRD